MFEGVAIRTFVPLLLRFGLAAVFIYHGLEKVHPDHNYGWKWADDMGMSPPPAGAVQLLVAWGELLGGVAVAVGLLTRVASIGLILIMIGAIVTVTGAKGFSGATVGGGYEFNFVLILMA